MNNLQLLKAQCKLALKLVDDRLLVGIVNYITMLERAHELDAAKIEQLKADIKSLEDDK